MDENAIKILDELRVTLKKFNDQFNDFEINYDKTLKSFETFLKSSGKIIPTDFNDFFNWLCCCVFPDDPPYHMFKDGIKPNYFKLFHEYKERLFYDPNWGENEEYEYLTNLKDSIITNTRKLLIPNYKSSIIIRENIEKIDSKGWQYVFKSENDFNMFVDILALYFNTGEFKDENNSIENNRGSITRFAHSLNNIYIELGQHPLKGDIKFLNICRVIKDFKNKTDTQITKLIQG